MAGRKKLKDTRVGSWLKAKAPQVLSVMGDVLPDAGALNLIRTIAFNDANLSDEDKSELTALLKEQEVGFQEQVTRRWEADTMCDSWLSKNIRPLTLICLIAFYFILTVWDGVSQSFMPPQNYIDLLEVLMLTAFGAYFAGRSLEKTKK